MHTCTGVNMDTHTPCFLLKRAPLLVLKDAEQFFHIISVKITAGSSTVHCIVFQYGLACLRKLVYIFFIIMLFKGAFPSRYSKK